MKEMGKQEPTSVEGWQRHISEFSSKCEFGTPAFQALSDYYNLASLAEDTKSEEFSQFIAGGHLAHLPHESRVQLILHRIALLEHSIDQKQANIPDYAHAFTELSLSFQELMEEARNEAAVKFSND